MITLVSSFPDHERDRTFRSYSALLNWIAAEHTQYGHRRSAAEYWLGKPREVDPDTFQFSLYKINSTLTWWKLTADQFARLLNLQARYKSYCRYRREIEPEWREQPHSRTYWADNSVTIVQINKWGGTRQVMVIAPHGDLC